MATGGGKQPTFRTARAQRTVHPLDNKATPQGQCVEWGTLSHLLIGNTIEGSSCHAQRPAPPLHAVQSSSCSEGGEYLHRVHLMR